MLILILSDVLGLDSSSKLSFTVFKSSLTEILQALIEIFEGEDDPWPTS